MDELGGHREPHRRRARCATTSACRPTTRSRRQFPVQRHRRHLRLQGHVSAVRRAARGRAGAEGQLRTRRLTSRREPGDRSMEPMPLDRRVAARVRPRDDDYAQAARARARGPVRVEAAREVDVARRSWRSTSRTCRRGRSITLSQIGVRRRRWLPPPRRLRTRARAARARSTGTSPAHARRSSARPTPSCMAPWTLKKGGHDDLHDAEEQRPALVRPEPPRSPSRSAERLPAAAGRAGAVDLRAERRRRHRCERRALAGRRRLGSPAASLFVVLATANAGGYRYGASDQAFYIPAVMRALEPGSVSARRARSSTRRAG